MKAPSTLTGDQLNQLEMAFLNGEPYLREGETVLDAARRSEALRVAVVGASNSLILAGRKLLVAIAWHKQFAKEMEELHKSTFYASASEADRELLDGLLQSNNLQLTLLSEHGLDRRLIDSRRILPRTESQLAEERAKALELPPPEEMGGPITEFTCDKCDGRYTCPLVFDHYNLNGECLAEK